MVIVVSFKNSLPFFFLAYLLSGSFDGVELILGCDELGRDISVILFEGGNGLVPLFHCGLKTGHLQTELLDFLFEPLLVFDDVQGAVDFVGFAHLPASACGLKQGYRPAEVGPLLEP